MANKPEGPTPSFFTAMTGRRSPASIALAVVLVLTACGGGIGQKATPEPISLEYERSSGALVIVVDTYGGVVPPPSGRHVPEVSIYGDGLVVLASEDSGRRVGIDRAVTAGRMEDGELRGLLEFVVEAGFFQLDEGYMPSPAPSDMPWRQITVNLRSGSKTVSVYPFDYEDAPTAFEEVYRRLTSLSPSDATVFTPRSGSLTATDLGPIEDLPGGRGSQVAPWDTPLVGVSLEGATQGVRLEGEEYRVLEEFLLRYPPGQVFGSQEGRAYEVLLEADLPWETKSTG